MPMLLEDLAEELRRKAVEAARQAADHAVSRVPEAEASWTAALAALREQPIGEQAERLLWFLVQAFESTGRLVQSARDLGRVAEQMGATPERHNELEQAEQRFEELAQLAKRALEHRIDSWQPADPERLALGQRLAREGKTVSADEARARFHRSQD